MSMIQSDLLLGQEGGAGYAISRSLRFNSSDSAFLAYAVPPGTSTTFTASLWIKRSSISATYKHFLFTSNTANSGAGCGLGWTDGNAITVYNGNHNTTSAVYRDVSAWYYITLSVNAGTATLYVNGVQQVAGVTGFQLNGTAYIGRYITNAYYFDGYIADVYLVDGQALTPSSFTEVSATTGQLIPKAYTGTFTGNSFWLKFADNSAATATTLGKDSSGLGNNWSPSNLSVTAGAGNDSLTDSPTSYGTDTGAGGEVRGNYCTLNAVNTYGSTTLSNGNLEATLTTGGGSVAVGTIAVSSGKWYWEVTPSGSSNQWNIGIADSAASNKAFDGPNGWYYYADGRKVTNLSYTSYGSSFTGGDVIGVALDMDAGTVTFYKNNTSQGTAFNSGIAGKLIQPALNISATNSNAFIVNFGQRTFTYTAPSGFKALCDTNLPAPVVAKSDQFFQTALWTGNGGSQSISSLSFSPDFVWIKARSAGSTDHCLFDTIRGATKGLHSNQTIAEWTDTATLTAFNSNGFTLAGHPYTNGNGTTYVGWTWDAGSSTVTNTQGSITSSVRANASAGFSIVTYTGTLSGNGNATVGHGLGVAPQLVITKARSATSRWAVQMPTALSANNYLELNTTAAQSSWGTQTRVNPTSTVFDTIYAGGVNESGVTYVAYCFAPVAGYSSFGSYQGNGSTDGPFVFCGFRPRWVMVKGSSFGSNWNILDAARDPYNVQSNRLRPNASSAEATDSSGTFAICWDALSNGFKLRGGSGTNDVNQTNETFIYAAFAESPFQYARAR